MNSPVINLKQKLIICQMTIEKLSAATVEFYLLTHEAFSRVEGASCADVAKLAFMSPQAASRHIDRLERSGYLTRLRYRSWKLAPSLLHDKDLIMLNRTMIHA